MSYYRKNQVFEMRTRVKILGVLVDQVDITTAVERINDFVDSKENKLIVTPNAEMIMEAQGDERLQRIINEADLALPDGAGVVIASQILGQAIPERIAGIDIVQELFARGKQKEYSFYFLGGAPSVAQKAKERVLASYSNLKINVHHGYLTRELEEQVINDIIKKSPDILLVGMGVPLQEKWLARYLDEFSDLVGMGVGGTFDILAGAKKRAPQWMQQLYLEWFYRLVQEPQRIKRIIQLPKFMQQVLEQKHNNQ